MPPTGLATTAAATAGAPLLLAGLAGASGWAPYTVRPGDTVSDIATRHHTTVRTLVRANHLLGGGNVIRAGSRLLVPASRAGRAARPAAPRLISYTVRSGDTIIGIAGRLHVTPGTLLALNHLDRRGRIYAGQHLAVPAAAVRVQAKAAAARRVAASTAPYRVRSGDTVSHIALRMHTTSAAIIKLNRLDRAARIMPGQVLRVPVTRRSASSATTFLGRTYPQATVSAAARNRAALARRAVPSRAAMRSIIAATARRHGVDPALALAIACQESGFNQRRVSVANAIGAMQVIPAAGQWASQLAGRHLNLLDARDNATAGVLILKALLRSSASTPKAVAGYYQGLSSVQRHGMYADTKAYVRSVLALRARY